MSDCSGCLRSTHLSEHLGRPWCGWCSDYADRYLRHMSGGRDVECTLLIDGKPSFYFATPSGGDLLPGLTWTWPGATVAIWNRSTELLEITHAANPMACLELIIRNAGGDRLDIPPHQAREPHRELASLRTEIPPGRKLEMQFNPLATAPAAASRAGQYTAQAVFRNGDWQAVSESDRLAVIGMPWLLRYGPG